MRSAKLALQDAIGDAINAQFTTDSISATAVTNPEQGGSMPLAVIGQDNEDDSGTTKDQDASSIAHNIYLHSTSIVEVKQMADSVLQAVGPGETKLSLGASFYEVGRKLEANDLTTERRPEGDIYNALVRVRYQIGHR